MCLCFLKFILELLVGRKWLGVEEREGNCRYKKLYRRLFLRESWKVFLIFRIEVNDNLFFLLKEVVDYKLKFSFILMKSDLVFFFISDKGRNSYIFFILRIIGILYIILRGKLFILRKRERWKWNIWVWEDCGC